MEILPRELIRAIIAQINDFSTWCNAHFVSQDWLEITRALDAKKLYGFTKQHKCYNAKDILKFSEVDNDTIGWAAYQCLPNHKLHGSLLIYNNNEIIMDIQYHHNKKCGIGIYLYHQPRYLYVNHRKILLDKKIILYENDIPIFDILIHNKNECTIYLRKGNLIFCIGNKCGKMYIKIYFTSKIWFREISTLPTASSWPTASTYFSHIIS